MAAGVALIRLDLLADLAREYEARSPRPALGQRKPLSRRNQIRPAVPEPPSARMKSLDGQSHLQ
jgi:hypothetical protein